MKRVLTIVIFLSFFVTIPFSGFSQRIKDLEEATIKVAKQVGEAVVSISAVVRKSRRDLFSRISF